MIKKRLLYMSFWFLSFSLSAQEKLLVLLNEKAGRGQAVEIFEKQVKTKLKNQFQLEVFKGRGGKELYHHLMSREDLSNFGGVLGFGGDGTQNKIIKALAQKNLLRRVPLGVIPTGSANAIASSLLKKTLPEESRSKVQRMIEAIQSRRTRDLSLWTYETDQGKRGLSALGLSFGLMADIDIHSEPFRFLGAARFDFVGFFKWMGLKSYPANLEILTAKGTRIRVRGPFRQVFALSVSHLSEKVILAPQAALGANRLHVSYIPARSADHWAMFSYLTKLEKQPSSLSFVENLEAKAVTLNLKTQNLITIDGKEMKKGTRSLTLRPYPLKARVFTEL